VLEEISYVLVNGRSLKVVDRANLESVYAELLFNGSGNVSDETAQEAGRMVGAEAIVLGSVQVFSDIARLRFKTIETETAQIMASTSSTIANDGIAQTLLAQDGGTSAANTSTAVSSTASSGTDAVKPESSTYKVGDTGPAGGLIFYDKGNSIGGWRYLEAAPEDAGIAKYMTEAPHEFSGEAGNIWRNKLVKDEARELGRGKVNSSDVMEIAQLRGGGFNWAVQLCDTYELNGFDDWFLPSRDELNFMYGNLYMQSLGDLKGESYWSSTGYWNTGQAWFVNFSNGEHKTGFAWADSNKYNVRPIRQF
jgi:hypothetical protein